MCRDIKGILFLKTHNHYKNIVSKLIENVRYIVSESFLLLFFLFFVFVELWGVNKGIRLGNTILLKQQKP